MDWAMTISRFQTLIAGIIGFSGVIITLLWNASATRRLEQNKAHDERLSLLSAIWAELLVNSNMLVHTTNLLSSNLTKTDDVQLAPQIYSKLVYTANLHNIGKFGPRLNVNIVDAYSRLSHLEDVVASSTQTLSSWKIRAMCVADTHSYCATTLRSVKDAVSAIESAMQ
jgi:hypothetical protein